MDDGDRIMGFEAAACPLCDQTVSHAHAMNDGDVGELITTLLADNLRLSAEVNQLKRTLALIGRSN